MRESYVSWSNEEIRFLRDNYREMEVKNIAEQLERPLRSVYDKARRLGLTRSFSVRERFWKKVDKNGPFSEKVGSHCWVWTASITGSGYGQLNTGKRTSNDLAHRLSWELEYGLVPDGLFVMHRCDNKLCVRPSHLQTGTHEENMADMKDKDRSTAGERNPMAKVTLPIARKIRRRYATGKYTQAELGEEYGISRASVSLIVRGETWA